MFAGKAAVVTGGAAGIGRELTLKLLAENAHVWVADKNAGGLAALQEEAQKFGKKLETRVCDVTDHDALRKLRDEVEATDGALTYWLNNAGIAGLGDFQNLSEDDFDRVLDINLKALVRGTRVALEVMEEHGAGCIVNMASVAGHIPAPFMSAYCAAKHGVVGFSRALQAELRLKGSPVRILMVSPGFVDTQIIAKGSELGYPEWLSFMLASPSSVAQDVLNGIRRGKSEIVPTFNGKMMKGLYRYVPDTMVKSSRILLSRSWKDVFVNRLHKQD